jgi:hypothetical protein
MNPTYYQEMEPVPEMEERTIEVLKNLNETLLQPLHGTACQASRRTPSAIGGKIGKAPHGLL